MEQLPLTTNPFALMVNPQDVVQAVERSDRLSRLSRRICRPLDKPRTPREQEEVRGSADADSINDGDEAIASGE